MQMDDLNTQCIESAKPCIDDSWPKPQPVRNELLHVETLPPAIIPEPLRPWLVDISTRMQCPVDFTAVAALVMVGAVVGSGCGIRPKRKDDWLVIPNLWGGVVAPPTQLKTPSMEEALKPLSSLELKAKDDFDSCMKEYAGQIEMFKASREAIKREMFRAASAKNKTDSSGPRPDELARNFAELEEPDKPVWNRFKTNDATIEKMGELLSDNPRGMMLFRDELIGLLASWDKEGREPDRAFYLEAWNGNGSITSDRIGRGTVFVKNLCVSICGGIQPTKLTPYLYQAVKGHDNDGLIQRLQLMVYPDQPTKWELIDEFPDCEAKNKAFSVIETLTKKDFTKYGAVLDDGENIPYFRFADDAQEVFYEWLTELQRVKLSQDEEPIILEHLGKYRSLMPSIALIFHLIELADTGGQGPVSLQAAQMAAAWCAYLESHARRIYGLVTDIHHQAAARLSKKIKAGQLEDGFTAREVYRKGWSLLDSPENAQAACDELVDLGWLRQVMTKPEFQQREKVEYQINPKVIAKE